LVLQLGKGFNERLNYRYNIGLASMLADK
jgi:hypothetical protein